jgi:signal transduction histidine kinase
VDFDRVRFGDWVMALGGVAVLVVMLVDWYSIPELSLGDQSVGFNAWESFAVNDVILALAAVMALAAFVLTASQPTAAVPLALASLATLVAVLAFVLVVIRLIWTPDVTDGVFDAEREAGAWLGLVATSLLAAGCLASIRDERLPRPDHQVEPRLVQQ